MIFLKTFRLFIIQCNTKVYAEDNECKYFMNINNALTALVTKYEFKDTYKSLTICHKNNYSYMAVLDYGYELYIFGNNRTELIAGEKTINAFSLNVIIERKKICNKLCKQTLIYFLINGRVYPIISFDQNINKNVLRKYVRRNYYGCTFNESGERYPLSVYANVKYITTI